MPRLRVPVADFGCAVALVLLCFAIYANGYDHAFLLDSHHTILENPHVRSLSSIPTYFVDAGTFSILRSNVDYRPLLQVSYALNYAMGAYDMWWWHFTQVLLHTVCAIALFCLCKCIVLVSRCAAAPSEVRVVAFVAAAVFALHPVASGVVNYLSARSSLQVAAFLLPSFVVYLRVLHEGKARTWPALLLYTMALFTKVDAVAALAVYFMAEAWQRTRISERPTDFAHTLLAAVDRRSVLRLAPALLITAIYFAIRVKVMAPYDASLVRTVDGVRPLDYLLTQSVAWWEYVGRWFAPLDLVADDGGHPVYRSLKEGPVLLAIGGWLAVSATVLGAWRRAPHIAFICVSAFALLSPTSTFIPLGQIVNEHRPYLPLALLSLAWTPTLVRFGWLAVDRDRLLRVTFVLGAVALLAGLALLTWQRNTVFHSERSYWSDAVRKSPAARSHLNLGRVLMGEGEMSDAISHFERALVLAPYWYVIHVNLGVAHGSEGRHDLAARHFDKAVLYDTRNGRAHLWRGEYRLRRADYAGALDDFLQSIARNRGDYRIHKGFVTAYAGLGDSEAAFAELSRCLDLDPEQTAVDIVSMVRPFFDHPSRVEPGLRFFQRLERRLPDAWWVHYNIGTLAARLGNGKLAREAYDRAEALRNRSREGR